MTITVHNITIDGSRVPEGAPRWDPARYEHAVRRNLIYVFNSPVGHAIIPQIRRQLTIIPDATFAPDRAYSTPADPRAAAVRGATRYQCSAPLGGDASQVGAPMPHAARGTGVGSDVTIEYTPGDCTHDPSDRYAGFIRMMPPRHLDAPGAFSDEVLCHELAHAIRSMRGVQDCSAVGHRYGTFDEFCAVEVANVYASCRHRWVRGAYVGGARPERVALLDPFGTPNARQRTEAEWIERMRRQQPDFCHALGRIPRERASYNPFRRDRLPYVRYHNVW